MFEFMVRRVVQLLRVQCDVIQYNLRQGCLSQDGISFLSANLQMCLSTVVVFVSSSYPKGQKGRQMRFAGWARFELSFSPSFTCQRKISSKKVCDLFSASSVDVGHTFRHRFHQILRFCSLWIHIQFCFTLSAPLTKETTVISQQSHLSTIMPCFLLFHRSLQALQPPLYPIHRTPSPARSIGSRKPVQHNIYPPLNLPTDSQSWLGAVVETVPYPTHTIQPASAPGTPSHSAQTLQTRASPVPIPRPNGSVQTAAWIPIWTFFVCAVLSESCSHCQDERWTQTDPANPNTSQTCPIFFPFLLRANNPKLRFHSTPKMHLLLVKWRATVSDQWQILPHLVSRGPKFGISGGCHLLQIVKFQRCWTFQILSQFGVVTEDSGGPCVRCLILSRTSVAICEK